MIFEPELKRIGALYTDDGYQITLHPKPEDLPAFAKDFKVEIAGRRGNKGVLVSVKKNRAELTADSDLPRYAEIIGAQPGWRFDLAVLEGEGPLGRKGSDTRELSEGDIDRVLSEAEQIALAGFVRPAVITAWAGLEAAMRMRLRANGRDAGWGAMPREMVKDLYSSGVLLSDEFRQLEKLYPLRNEIIHGFASPTPDSSVVQFMGDIARRLVMESQKAEPQAV